MLKLGLLGRSLVHSLSRSIFDCLRDELDVRYENFSLEPDELESFFQFASENLDGFNITVPYKLKPFEFPGFFVFTDEVREIGAVNTVVVKNHRLYAYNTDHIGFIKPLEGIEFENVLVFGAGGAARAVVYALKNKRVFVYNRTHERAEDLSKIFPNVTPVREPANVLEEVELVVNATSVGLHGEPFYPLRKWRGMNFSGKIFYDLIYNPPLTDFLRIGLDGGARILNGFPMLIFQAIENIKLWAGRDLSREVIRCSKSLLPENPMEGILSVF